MSLHDIELPSRKFKQKRRKNKGNKPFGKKTGRKLIVGKRRKSRRKRGTRG